MSDGVLEAVGGLGLFLLGMSVMTQGLRRLAGTSLRSTLKRFTRSPTSGALTGALATAIVQSSSATTVTAVGFVGAGLLTFAEAIGIIFGANVGTTITGWLVALFGFKVKLGTIAFPMVLGGALLRTFGRGRWSSIGEIVAGFAVIFIGIDVLQGGLAGLEDTLTPASFPPDTWVGRLQLLGIGAAITLVTQSSSAGVALAITAVHAGTIEFGQAAAIVIGMDVGTTVTAAIATVGGGTQVRRTGLAHVIYNVMTGTGAYFLLVGYVHVVEAVSPDALRTQPELLLVGFHTLFNGVGVLAALPFARQFASLVERVVRPADDTVADRLDESLLADPDAALDVLTLALTELSADLFDTTSRMLASGEPAPAGDVERQLDSLRACRAYLTEIRGELDGDTRERQAACLHVMDHIDRILGRLTRAAAQIAARSAASLLVRDRDLAARLMRESVDWLAGTGPAPTRELLERASRLADDHRTHRAALIDDSLGRISADEIDAMLDGHRWLVRVTDHVARIDHYLRLLRTGR